VDSRVVDGPRCAETSTPAPHAPAASRPGRSSRTLRRCPARRRPGSSASPACPDDAGVASRSRPLRALRTASPTPRTHAAYQARGAQRRGGRPATAYLEPDAAVGRREVVNGRRGPLGARLALEHTPCWAAPALRRPSSETHDLHSVDR